MVKLYKIKFIKETEKCKVGDIKNASKKSADAYVKNGYAEYVKEEKKMNWIKEEWEKHKASKEKLTPLEQELKQLAEIYEEKPLDVEERLKEMKEKYGYSISALKKQMKVFAPIKKKVKKDEPIRVPPKKKEQEKIKITEELKEKLKSPELLKMVKEELDKNHLLDDNVKLTAFIVALSGLLKNPKKRMSMALTGESSVGKDNLIKTILQHFPNDLWMFLTGATQPALEDDAIYVPILALSEMNLFREEGANKNILEVVKQRTEGGTSAIKKDAATGFKTTKHEKTEQGTTFYNTTEAERNNESETRFIFGNVEADEKKIKIVNKNSCLNVSDINKLLETSEVEESWISLGLKYLKQEFYDCEVLIPYANVLLEEINGVSIIDNSSPRSMRDLKRLLSLTSALTFFYVLQRKIKEYKGKRVIVSEPEDLLQVLRYSKEFFNQTYQGMDERLYQILQILDNHLGEWVARDVLQRNLRVSLNTIKGYCASLEEAGLVEWKKGADLNFQEGVKSYDGNKIYFKRYQKGVKKMLIRCEENELKDLLDKKYRDGFYNNFDTLMSKRYQKQGVNLKGEESNKKMSLSTAEIDTFSLTPFEKEEAIKLLPKPIEMRNKKKKTRK